MTATPAMQTAQAAAKSFLASLPPATGPDFAKFVADLATGLKAEISVAIQANAPHIPLIGGLVKTEETAIAFATIDNAVASLSAYVQTGGA